MKEALLLLWFLAVSGLLCAQDRFTLSQKSHINLDTEVDDDLLLVDLDGDGDLDLLATNRIFINDGSGRFRDESDSRLPGRQPRGTSLAAGDVDLDGDMDFIVGIKSTHNRLFINQGGGLFLDMSAAQMPSDQSDTTCLRLADFDGDGDLDFFACNEDQFDQLALNDGNGNFQIVSSSHLPPTALKSRWVSVADFDGDGDLDLWISVRSDDGDRLYENDGSGVFTDVSSIKIPRNFTESSDVGDLDGDGDIDIIARRSNDDDYFMNDGTGRFTKMPTALLVRRRTNAIALADLDQDGDLDLIRASARDCLRENFRYQDSVVWNDGLGRFLVQTELPPNERGNKITYGDVDGDGDIDIVVGRTWRVVGHGTPRIYLNDGAGGFEAGSGPVHDAAILNIRNTARPVLADFDGDGDQDLLVARGSALLGTGPGDRSQWQFLMLMNDGAGEFRDETDARLPIQLNKTSVVRVADLDGDGALDIASIHAQVGSEPNLVFLHNSGAGVFSDDGITLSETLPTTSWFAFGDLDGDQDLDLFTRHRAGQTGNSSIIKIWVNDGSGEFLFLNELNISEGAGRFEIRDVDADGDGDLLIPSIGMLLYLNHGGGNFTDVSADHMPVLPVGPECFAIGDVDGDGDVDLLLGINGQDRLLLNGGDGRFTDATVGRIPQDVLRSRQLELIDFDLDGDLDILRMLDDFTNSHLAGLLAESRVLLNDGSGRFLGEAPESHLLDSFPIAATGDLDGDGDVDLIIPKNKVPHLQRVFNRQRQLTSPFMPVVGGTYVLEAFDMARDRATLTIAAPFASLRRLPAGLPLPPIGSLFLDPARLFPLPWILIAPGDTSSRISLGIPADPSLIDASLYAQALFAEESQGEILFRLSNLVSDRILR